MGNLTLLEQTAASVPTPDPGYNTLFWEAVDGFPYYKDSGDVVHGLVGVADVVGTAPITSSGGAMPNIGITPATTAAAGSMSAADKQRMGQVYDAVADLGFVGDLISRFDGACNVGAPTKITSPGNPFAAGDVGKRITLAEAGAAGAMYVGTITAFDNAGQVTVAPNISATVAGKGLSWGTDNTAAITAMMTLVNTTRAAFPGTKIIFGESTTNAFGFPIPMVFNQHVHLQGIGGSFNADAGDYTRGGGTRLAWWGASQDGGVDFGAFITIQPAAGATQPILNPIIEDLWIDGRNGDQNAALIGIRLAGCSRPLLRNLFLIDCGAIAIQMLATQVGTVSPAGARGVIRPRVDQVNVRMLEAFTGAITAPLTTVTAITLTNVSQNITVSAATMPTTAAYAWLATNEGARCLVKYTGGGTVTLGVKCSVDDAIYQYATVATSNVVSACPQNGSAFDLSGDLTANTNCGLFTMMQISHGSVWGPAAITLRNSDSNELVQAFINGGNPTSDGAVNRIRKEGVVFHGSNINVGLPARNNVFRDGDPSSSQAAGATALGLLNTAAKIAFPSGPNMWFEYQLGNGARAPVIEMPATGGGASLQWTTNGGVAPCGSGVVSIADQLVAPATLTVLVGSILAIPPQGFKAGATYRWTIDAQTTVGAAVASQLHLRIGANGTTADAAIFSPTLPAGTAVANIFWRAVIEITIRVPGAAATSWATLRLNNDTATGFVNRTNVVFGAAGVAFNSVTSGLLYASISYQGGAGVTTVFKQVMAEVVKPAN